MNEPAAFGTGDPHPWYFDTDHENTPPLMCRDDNKYDKPPYETWAVYWFQVSFGMNKS